MAKTWQVVATWERYRDGYQTVIWADIDASTPDAAMNKMKQFIRASPAIRRGRLVSLVAHDRTSIPF